MIGNFDRRLRKLEEGFGERAYERIIEGRIRESLTLENPKKEWIRITLEAMNSGYSWEWIFARFPSDEREEVRRFVNEAMVRSGRLEAYREEKHCERLHTRLAPGPISRGEVGSHGESI
jgi:hypothetical protein